MAGEERTMTKHRSGPGTLYPTEKRRLSLADKIAKLLTGGGVKVTKASAKEQKALRKRSRDWSESKKKKE